MLSRGNKMNVSKSRPQIEREFAPRVMVSAGGCYDEGECQILRGEFASKSCLAKIRDCSTLLPGGFIFQQDGVPCTHRTIYCRSSLLTPTVLSLSVRTNGSQIHRT